MEEENEGGLQGAERQGSGEETGRGRGMKEGRWGGRAKASAVAKPGVWVVVVRQWWV